MLTGTDLMTIERTLQLAIAPAFILGGIMSLLTLLTGRLQRLADLHRDGSEDQSRPVTDPRRLVRRARIIYRSIQCAILSALLLSVLVITAFVEPLAGVTAGAHIAGLLIAAIASLAASLFFFLWEVVVSARTLPLRHK